jgi:hypothetical protein
MTTPKVTTKRVIPSPTPVKTQPKTQPVKTPKLIPKLTQNDILKQELIDNRRKERIAIARERRKLMKEKLDKRRKLIKNNFSS